MMLLVQGGPLPTSILNGLLESYKRVTRVTSLRTGVYFIPFIPDNGPPCHFSSTCDFLRFNDTFSDSLQSGWYLTEIYLYVPGS